MIQTYTYEIKDVARYINWAYFYHAWGVTEKAQGSLRDDASKMLDSIADHCRVSARVGLFEANSDGDDIVIGETRLPMLRQQTASKGDSAPMKCLADYVMPLSKGGKDTIGVFATTVEDDMTRQYRHDDYARLLAQTLADRLAEAAAEVLHRHVRTTLWGYAPQEELTIEQLHSEAFQGIRPAIGYPSLPDCSLNFIIDQLLNLGEIGIRLTPSGMMQPHASVSGLMLSHPKAHYFDVGPIGEDQLRDYARRRGLPTETMRKFLQANLMKR